VSQPVTPERECPACGQVDVTIGENSVIVDHNKPDGTECSSSDISWGDDVVRLMPKRVERRTYVSTERLAAAERECEQLRAENELLRSSLFAMGGAVSGADTDPRWAMLKVRSLFAGAVGLLGN
jgi:hypothetical protein